MLLYRILSALVGIPVILFAVWYGGIPLSILILILVVAGILELNKLWQNIDIRIWVPGAVLGGLVFVTAAHLGVDYYQELALFCLLSLSLFYLIAVYPSFSITGLAVTLFSSLYAGWFLTHVILIRQVPDGFHFLLLVFVSTWSTDTFAYFTGMSFGKHKLSRVLSPKKSVEGLIGGIAGSIIAAVILGIINRHMALVHYAVLGLLISVIGQAGDLVESAFKRMAGVKDSGALIPGHGGVLDRFDSLFLTAPAVYYYLKILVFN